MNTHISTFVVVVLWSANWSVFSFAKDYEAKNQNDSVCIVHLSLDTPNLVPPAVQFAIFDKDPVPAFKASLRKLKPYHRKELEKTDNQAKRKITRQIFLKSHWNLMFRQVTGAQVHLLTSAPGATQSTVSKCDDGKKWLVTKAVFIHKEPIYWCLPFEAKAGVSNEIVVSEEKAFDMEAVYKELMSATD